MLRLGSFGRRDASFAVSLCSSWGDSSSRPPCQSFTVTLHELRSATFHGPSSQGALPRWPRSAPASVAITRGNVFWPHVELFKSACFTVLLPRKNGGGTIFRSTPPKWILKAEEVAGSFYLARVGWGFLTSFRKIFDSTRPVSDRPKPRLWFRCDYYRVITACCDSLVYLGCTDTHVHAKCKRLSVCFVVQKLDKNASSLRLCCILTKS